jgi:prolyl-tRNA synthetase
MSVVIWKLINSFFLKTHEEAITSIVADSVPLGRKRLPLLLYQLDTKFRDELRPKFGLMRTKEFVMKDLYTFHGSEECAANTYEQVCQAYLNIFKRLGLSVFKGFASHLSRFLLVF